MGIHLCIDARLYGFSGIGTFLKAALTFLNQKNSYQISILCRQEQKNACSTWTDSLIEMQSPIYTLQEQWEFRKKIPHCDLFWSPHFNVPLFPIPAKKRLVTIHDVYHLAFRHTFKMREKIYAQLMYETAWSISDTVTTISEFSKAEILRVARWKPENIQILSPGFDHFSPLPLNIEKTHLLFVGNLKPHKNLVRLVQAYERLHPKEPLFIVGKREGLRHPDTLLMRQIEKSPFLKKNVSFIGEVDEKQLHELYAGAKIFLFPSLYEGFGYPPLEAMAYGAAVVASRVASLPEVCEDAAEYIDPTSIDSLTEAIDYLLNHSTRREELSVKGKSLFQKKKAQKNLIGEVIDACCRDS